MVLDLLSTDMYINFNLKLAHRIGLHAAIYLGELLNINKKAIQKSKINEEGYFKLDRNYIEQRTTLQSPEQKELDKVLEDLSIINIDSSNKNLLKINTDALTGILLDDNSVLVDKIIQPIRKKRVTKQEAILNNLKENIVTTNEELRKAYEEWIEAVMARQGWMSAACVRDGQEVVDKYSNRDLDIALKIVGIGASNGFRDLNWAINTYEKKCREKNKRSYSNVDYNNMKPAVIEDEVF